MLYYTWNQCIFSCSVLSRMLLMAPRGLVNDPTPTGHTALHIAAERGFPLTAKTLISVVSGLNRRRYRQVCCTNVVRILYLMDQTFHFRRWWAEYRPDVRETSILSTRRGIEGILNGLEWYFHKLGETQFWKTAVFKINFHRTLGTQSRSQCLRETSTMDPNWTSNFGPFHKNHLVA